MLSRVILTMAGVLGSLTILAMGEQPCTLEWARQLGTDRPEVSFGVSTDGIGNVYIGGITLGGSLGGPNLGGNDVFVSKYDASGDLLWIRQSGTSAADDCYAISADAMGNVYAVGDTLGSPGSYGYPGDRDALVIKYDTSGSLLWSRKLGTNGRDKNDLAQGVSSDASGNVFVSGYTNQSLGGPNQGNWDAFLGKYDSAGNVLWVRQLGTSDVDRSYGVSTDEAGNAYMVGYTKGSLGGPNLGSYDVFVAKYNPGGDLLWTRQFGTNKADADDWDEKNFGVSTDGLGNFYVCGSTWGSLGGPTQGSWDVFLSKFDSDGNAIWQRQIGTTGVDMGYAVSADRSGNVYVSGSTWGSLEGSNQGQSDAFLAGYDAAGNHLWTRQIGTTEPERAFGISADRFGNVYVTGDTNGSLGGLNQGWSDAFLIKYAVPEPATLSLLALGGLALMRRRSQVRGRRS